MFKDLKHLSEKEVSHLMNRYYSGEATSTLLKEYQLSIPASQLYKFFPPEIFPDEMCDYCPVALVRDRLPRSASPWLHKKNRKYCIFCHHVQNDPNCRCTNCVQKEARLKEKQRQEIEAWYSKDRTPVDFSDLSFEQKVFLGALCRGLCDESLFQIKPLVGANVRLTPSKDLSMQLYLSLRNSGIITISPTTPIEAFDVNDESFPSPESSIINMVTYNLNLHFAPDKQGLFNQILNPTYYSEQHKNEALRLWKKIAVGECIEYLIYQLHEIRFDFTPGEKTVQTFELLLNDFSVSQIYGIIWKEVKHASALYLARKLTKIHAANSVISGCARYGERAKVNGWNLTEYNRPYDLPQSELSAFFFYKVLGIGEKGFKTPPSNV